MPLRNLTTSNILQEMKPEEKQNILAKLNAQKQFTEEALEAAITTLTVDEQNALLASQQEELAETKKIKQKKLLSSFFSNRKKEKSSSSLLKSLFTKSKKSADKNNLLRFKNTGPEFLKPWKKTGANGFDEEEEYLITHEKPDAKSNGAKICLAKPKIAKIFNVKNYVKGIIDKLLKNPKTAQTFCNIVTTYFQQGIISRQARDYQNVIDALDEFSAATEEEEEAIDYEKKDSNIETILDDDKEKQNQANTKNIESNLAIN